MATSKSTLVCVVLLVILLCLLVFKDNSECSSEHGYSHGHAIALNGTKSRKITAALKEKKAALNASLQDAPPVTANNGNNSLRKIPSGPDPLHHNGGNPKKPKTP